MALNIVPLPFGCHDVRLFPLAGETPGTGVDLPNSRVLTFAEAETFEELRGDDALIAIHGKGPEVNWDLESGGISFEAYAVMAGGTITTTGTTPNQIKKYAKKNTDLRPYFKAEGQALSDSGGDFHVVIYRMRVTGDLSGKMTDSAFWLTGVKGRALGRLSDGSLYDFVQNESQTAITG